MLMQVPKMSSVRTEAIQGIESLKSEPFLVMLQDNDSIAAGILIGHIAAVGQL